MKARSEIFYELIEGFYSSMLIFEEQRDEYEYSVLALAAREEVDRRDLRLPTHEVARLLDFKVLSELRDTWLKPLRRRTRMLFGGLDRDMFDIMVSDIFHLVSILKEEEFRVSHYAVLYDKMKRTVDRDYILEAVHHDFPILLDQTHHLFIQAKDRLHTHLPRYGQDTVVLRSLYLHGESFLNIVYKDEGGVDGFWWHMFPENGPLKAYLSIGRSFVEGGFNDEASGAFEKAKKKVDPQWRSPAYLALAKEVDDFRAKLGGAAKP